MALNSKSLLFLTFTIFFTFFSLEVSAALGGRKGAIVGGWKPIEDPKDPKVVEIGKFAINEENKKIKPMLKFHRVVKGETQVVSGTNYKLVIAAKDGSVDHQYEAVVYDQPWTKTRELTSFKKIA